MISKRAFLYVIKAFPVILAAAFCLSAVSCGKEADVSSSSSGVLSHEPTSSYSKGELSDNPLADPIGRLAGRYFVDGDTTAASLVVSADGSFAAYYAGGTLEESGYVRYEAEITEGGVLYVYVFYTDNGNPFMGFIDSGEAVINEFETGNGGGLVYKRVNG